MYVFFGSEVKNHNGQFLNIWSPNDNSLGYTIMRSMPFFVYPFSRPKMILKLREYLID